MRLLFCQHGLVTASLSMLCLFSFLPHANTNCFQVTKFTGIVDTMVVTPEPEIDIGVLSFSYLIYIQMSVRHILNNHKFIITLIV